jgi:hypothetical protein
LNAAIIFAGAATYCFKAIIIRKFPPRPSIFPPVSHIFQKTCLTVRAGGPYKAAIDGVAAELSGEALARLH